MLHGVNERPKENKYTGRYVACILLMAAVVLLFGARLIQWQLFDKEELEQLSASSSSQFITLQATRGEILDTDGNVLAGNRTVYIVRMNAITMDAERRNEIILSLLDILEQHGEQWIDMLPIYADESGYHFYPDRESEITYMKGQYMLNMQSYATAQDCVTYMKTLYKVPDGLTDAQLMKLLSVRYYMQKLGFSVTNPYTVAEDISARTVAVISELAADLPGVEISVSTQREYPSGIIAPHIVGEIYSITQKQYDALSSQEKYSAANLSGYTYSDKIGQSGIESAFEKQLRGSNGKEILTTDETGEITGTQIATNPTAGNTVVLTIDSALQQTALDSLSRNVAAANAAGKEKQAQAVARGDEKTSGYGEDCVAGAAVVLSVKDFSVLAAATFPSYDLSLYTSDKDYLEQLYADADKPLYNRAFRGTFTPGSVFKPAVAIGALEEGIIDSSTEVDCQGTYRYYSDYQPTCMGYHRNVTVRSAIAQSCNIFFYDVGRQLTIYPMGEYARLLGLGTKTGIEIAESEGTMSSPEEYYETHGVKWTDGLTIQTAIGQCDNSFTPLQLATYAATIANKGVRLKTHLLKQVVDYTRTQVISTYTPEVAADLQLSASTIQIVQDAMRQVAISGTASGTFANYGIAIAAKTGTAEVPGHSDNVTFIAFAPYDDPQIAVAVVLEYGAAGTYSMAVAKDIFDAYFDLAPAVQSSAG